MADNNNNNNNGNGNGNGIDPNLVVGITALVISVIAFVGTTAQVLQQYYSSATGYTNCGESVMGEWHRSKKRIFKMTELRFEVQFEAPVIFVCPPTNDKGPVKGAPIHYIDGTHASLISTRTLLPKDAEKQKESRGHVHTADNERASWVMLLSELQSMEKESQDWQQLQYGKNPPQSDPQATFSQHSLAVALQAKTRSWDTMPSNVKKPYATTAMCHLIEIAAMLGIYWKEFDRSKDKYRAEGNGYIITGTHVTDLGIMFTFQQYGKPRFNENRVIPVDEVKEMCCGFMSTIFRKQQDGRRLQLFSDEPQDLSIVQLGSRSEMAETMVLIGCNTNTANYFRSDKAKVTHLFPVAFELLGMLGRTLHIPNSCFRMLPNPTPYHWDKKFFSLRKLMKEFKKKLTDDDLTELTEQVLRVINLAEKVCMELRGDPIDFGIPLLEALHGALDYCDEYLRDLVSRELVTLVLREHFQAVLKMINNPEEEEELEAGSDIGTDRDANSPIPHFDDLNAASPEERQEKFMDIYFAGVLPLVKERAVRAFNRRRSTRYAPSNHERDASVGSAHSAATGALSPNVENHGASLSPSPAPAPTPASPNNVSPAGRPRAASATPGPPTLHAGESTNSTPFLQVHIAGAAPSVNSVTSRNLQKLDADSLDKQAHNIWCTLMFRMLCWLLLHDFHKKDVQIPKSELLGSRLSVYIA